MTDPFDEVAAVADAVLFEGYLLYPYRASAQKNRVRWQWGVLMPPGTATDSGEVDHQRTECLVEPRGDAATLRVRLRFLHLQRRTLPTPRAATSRSWPSGTPATSRSTRACRSTSTRS